MRTAIFDLGTNTFNLLISENKKAILKTKIAVKLGEGGLDKGIISEPAFNRGINALIDLNKIVKLHNCSKIKAVATSGIRSTKNGFSFINKVKETTGISIEVIDGNKEAELIYLGVKDAITIKGTSLIMDIGGGSTEFIIANENEIVWKQSFKLGASRLKETFKPSNPIKKRDINALEGHFNEQLKPLFDQLEIHKVGSLIGSSGSFDTFTEMHLHMLGTPHLFDEINCYNIPLDFYYSIHEFFLNSTEEERLNTPGIIPMRVDMIVIASVFVYYILKRTEINTLYLSKFALKEGLLSELNSK